MTEFLSRFNGGEIIGMVAVAGVFLCGALGIITDCFHKLRVTALKEEMVKQGMSAEDIQTVLTAGKRSCKKKRERDESFQS